MTATIHILPVVRSMNAPELPCDCEPASDNDDVNIFVFEMAKPFADKVRALAAKDDCPPDECARALVIYALAAIEKGIVPDVMGFYARTMRPSASTG